MVSLSSLALFNVILFVFTTFHHVIAFGPQPAGYTHDAISELARKRYYYHPSTTNDDDVLPPPPMSNRVVVITGAASGIGREVSSVVYRLGGTVVALDRNGTGLASLQQTLCADKKEEARDDDDDRLVTLITHHENLTSVSTTADIIKSKFDTIDILINNAGMTYPRDGKPGLSAHGMDLSFTVNYLSHFLLTEKLIPNIAKVDGRVVHLTSTYHWKVDGSDIIPGIDGSEGPRAYRGMILNDDKKEGKQRQQHHQKLISKHVERAYANSKLAQIWHSRSITKCKSVCVCPTFVATNIAGEEFRTFLGTMGGFDVTGAGITSVINAMLRTDTELAYAMNDNGDCIVANSRIIEYLIGKEIWLTSKWITNWGWRDVIADVCALIVLMGQRYTHDEFIVQRSSPESYGSNNNKVGREALYEWSKKEVAQWM